MKAIVKQLQKYMIENGLSQCDISNILGVSQSSVSHWFHGKNSPNKESIQQIESMMADDTDITSEDIVYAFQVPEKPSKVASVTVNLKDGTEIIVKGNAMYEMAKVLFPC